MLDGFVKQTSHLVKNQFPEIYRENGKELIAFVEAYYEFLETNPKYSTKINREMFNTMDIDRSLDDFIEHFSETYIKDFPNISSVDRRLVIKHIIDYYKIKGSEQGLKLLMNLVFNEDIKVYYPNKDILKPSYSDWYKPYYLEVTVSERNRSFIGKQVEGAISGATAFVETVVRKRINSKLVDIIYLSSVRGQFETGERITDNGELVSTPVIVGSLTRVEIENGGRDNKVGDVYNVISEHGTQGKVVVREVIDATGRVDFVIDNPGWGYTTDDTTDVYISDAVIFIDNPGLDYILEEEVYQRIETIDVISATDILSEENLIGRRLDGVNVNDSIIGVGTIVGVANTNSQGVTLDPSANGTITVETTTGTFNTQNTIEVVDASPILEGDTIYSSYEYDVTVTNIIGSFQVGEIVLQNRITEHGELIENLGVELDDSTDEIDVGSTANIITGQEVRKVTGTGEIENCRIIEIIDENNIRVSRTPTVSGATDIDILPLKVKDEVFRAEIDFIDDNVLTLVKGFGDLDMANNLLLEGKTSGASSSISNIQILKQSGTAEVIRKTSNTLIINPITGAWVVGDYIKSHRMTEMTEIVTNTDSGAIVVYLDEMSSANGVIQDVDTREPRGIIIGQNTSAIGVWGNTSPFYAYTDIDTHIYTDRSKMISPPTIEGVGELIIDEDGNYIADEEGNDIGNYAEAIDFGRRIIRIAGGSGANFRISRIGDVEESVPLYLDVIGDKNVSGVPYLQIEVGGGNSGFGFISDLEIVDGGSGYANNDIISFMGGGYANSNPNDPAEAFIETDSSGTITSIYITSVGSEYYTEPTLVLPNNGSGDDATINLHMINGYGFPKNPSGGYYNMIEDVLDHRVSDLGSIQLLGSINPGHEYTANPFVWVRNKYVAAHSRYDLILVVDNVRNGMFRPGDWITQTVSGIRTRKGRVRAIGEDPTGKIRIYLERMTFGISFSDGVKLDGSISGANADLVMIYEDDSLPPIGLNGVVSANTSTAMGVATQLEILSSGFGYIDGEHVELIPMDKDDTFIMSGETKVEMQGTSEGFWRTTTSHISHDKMIHDNHYYQEYSYDVISAIDLEQYKNMLSKVFHVAGTKMFGSVSITTNVINNITVTDSSISANHDLNG